MNKKQIFEKLEELKLDKNKIIIISGASLVVQDVLLQTSDIDMACKKEYYSKINWPEKIGYFGSKIKFFDVFEIGVNFYEPKQTVTINGYKFMNLDACLKLKKLTNRDRDKQVIKLIKNKNGVEYGKD